MFEQLGLGVRFEFQNYGHSDILNAMSDMSGLYDTARQGGRVLGDMQKSFETTTQQIESYASTMVKAGAAITGAFGFGINASKNFESQLAGLKKYMSDVSATGISNFNKQLSDSAKELGVAKTEIMKASQEYMAMGLAQDKALEMASAVTKAGKIWDVASQEAAEAFKGIAAAYNMDFLVKDTRDEFVDLVNYVADNTALVGKDSLNFLSAAGASLKTMGNTDMKGALGIASAAAKAQVDITHLGYGMNTMIRRYSAKGESYFKEVGLDATDATGKLRPFNEMLDELAKKMQAGEIEQEKISTFASQLGGFYASDLLRVLNAWSEYDKTMEAINSKAYAGSAEREWKTITATFEHQANITKVIWADFIQATFGQLLPIVTKIVSAFNKAFSALTTFLSNHPKISAFATALFGLAGITLLLGGTFMLFVTKISKWLISLQVAKAAGLSFNGMLNVMKLHMSNLTSAFGPMAKQLLGIGITFGIVYLMMKYDILGLRSMFEKFVSTIRNSFNDSKMIMQASAGSISQTLQSLDQSNAIGDKLTALFTRIGIGWQGLKDMWSDYEISDEMYDKLVASGMLPVVTSIMMLVYRLRETWRGFKDGFNGMCEIIRNTIQNVLAPPFNWLKDNIIVPALDFIQKFMIKVGLMSSQSSLLTSASSKWYAFGKAIGSAGPFLILFGFVQRLVKYASLIGTVFSALSPIITAPFKLLGTIISKIPFGSFVGAFRAIGSAFGSIVSTISSVGSAIFNVLSTIVQSVIGFISSIGAPVIAIIAVVVLSVVSFAVRFKQEFDKIVSTIKTTFFSVVEGIVNKFLSVIDSIKQKFGEAKQLLMPAIDSVKEAIGNIVGAFKNIKDALIALAQNEGVQTFFGILADVFALIGGVIVSVVVPAFNLLQTVFGAVAQFAIGVLGSAINGLIDIIVGVVSWIVYLFSGLVNIVSGFINTIAGFITGLLTGDFEGFKQGIAQIGQGILQILTGLGEAIGGILTGIVGFLAGYVSSFFELGLNIVHGLIDGIISIGSNIWSTVTSVFQSIIDGVKSLFGIASPSTVMASIGNDIINGLIQGIQNLVQGVFDIFTGMADTVVGIAEGLGTTLSGVWDGISSVATTAWDGISGVASGAFEGVKGLLGGLWDDLTGKSEQGASNVTNTTSNCWDGMTQGIDTAFSGVPETVASSWNEINSTITTAITTINSTVSAGWTSIASATSSGSTLVVQPVVSSWTRMSTSIMISMRSMLTAVSSGWTSINSSVISIVTALVANTMNLFRTMTTNLISIIVNFANVARSTIQTFVSAVISMFSSMGSSISSTMSHVVSSIVGGFSSAKGSAISTVSSMCSSIKSQFSGLSSGAYSYGANMVNGFVNGIRSKISAVRAAANEVTRAAKGPMGFSSPAKEGEGRHIVEWGANMIGGFIDGIISAIPALHNTMMKVIKAPELVTTVDTVVNGDVNTKSNAVVPALNNDYVNANRRNVDNIYNSRSEVNDNSTTTNTNGGTINLSFNEGAFRFDFGGSSQNDILEKMPDVQNYIEQAVLDLIKKLKNQQYEM